MTTREAHPKRLNLNLNLDRLDILVLGVLIGLFLAAVGMSLYFHFRTSLPDLADWLDSVLQNAGTEMLGAFLTFYLIEVMLRKRREGDAAQQAIEREKRRLILQMGSPESGFAVEALRILRSEGWGIEEDTTLHKANLWRANLQGADLALTNLQGASLGTANLQEAYLLFADLRGAELLMADLRGATLEEADLRGANLREADLQGAKLRAARFDEETVLPDETRWARGTDMARFTNPKRPDFWRSHNPESPAYRGAES